MQTPQGWGPVGHAVQASAIAGPLAATGLARGEAELAWVEVGLAQQVLEPDGGQFEGVAGELGAQRSEGGRGVVVHGVLVAAPHPDPLPAPTVHGERPTQRGEREMAR